MAAYPTPTNIGATTRNPTAIVNTEVAIDHASPMEYPDAGTVLINQVPSQRSSEKASTTPADIMKSRAARRTTRMEDVPLCQR